MVFSSITFLFFFLPFTLLLCIVAQTRLRNIGLLLASLFFYAWGEGVYLLLMLLSIGVNYLLGLLLAQPQKRNSHPSLILGFGIIINLGLLAFFKYANFLNENLNLLMVHFGLPALDLEPVHLPIGISFFTFQALSYIIDVRRGAVSAQRNIVSLSLYISLFPQLIAGPIVRYRQIAKQLSNRVITLSGFAEGAQRFLFGLAKKVLLANPMGAIADQVFSLSNAELSPSVAWLGAICYTFQIYFDFSGYSDMAIGLGRMFGFTFPENFNYPYISSSIREFWRRWHISLSSWFRDYLYIPLGGNRKGHLRTSFNLLTVFLLCGLWHGASWTFVIWGLYHGLFLTLERTALGAALEKLWTPFRHALTMFIVCLGWVLFRSESMSQASHFIAVMLGAGSVGAEVYPLIVLLDGKMLFELTMAVLFSLPLYPTLLTLRDRYFPETGKTVHAVGLRSCYAVQFICTAAFTYLTVISLAAGAYNPFIYFRF